jgi:peptide/nickel transport system permease protein
MSSVSQAVTSDAAVLSTPAAHARRGLVRRFGRIAWRQPIGVAAGVVLASMIIAALLAPVIAPSDPMKVFSGHALEGPSGTFRLGTDTTGRDVLSRLVYGARVSLGVGFGAVLFGVGLGTVLGLSVVVLPPLGDLLLQRLADILQAFPGLVLALAIAAALGPGARSALIALTVILVPAASRIIRSHTLVVQRLTFIEAARSCGASPWRIVWQHVLPNVLGTILVLGSIMLGGAILAEASLSFLGAGVQAPAPSWGQMLARDGKQYFREFPGLAIFPGVAISLTVLTANLFGDTVRDWLDPRLRGVR